MMNKNIVKVTLFTLIIFNQLNIYCQNSAGERNHEFVGSVNYNFPLGKLSWVYKPTVGIQFGFNWIDRDPSENKIIKTGFTIGALQFKPKADTLYYLVTPTTYGTASFSKYQLVYATFHIEKIKIFNKTGFLIGADAGLVFVHYTDGHIDANIDYYEESMEGKLMLSPQFGIYIEFTPKINATLVTQYNALISLGDTDPNSVNYNSNAGIYRQFVSENIRVAYTF